MKDVLILSRLALGVIFLWYGILKFFPELSPAETLATKTIDILLFGMIPADISIKLLALWEVFIGLALFLGIYLRFALILFFIHMFLTFSPLVLLPELCFTSAPFAFTLVGQYIIKNIVFILVGVLLYQDHKTKTLSTNLK